MFQIIVENRPAFLGGLTVTLQICLAAWAAGFVFGIPLGVACAHDRLVTARVVKCLHLILSAVPVIVGLLWLHYPLQAWLEIVIDPRITAACLLSVVNIVSVAIIVWDSWNSVPLQFIDAAKVAGLRFSDTLLFVRSPLMLRNAIPPLLISQITILQLSLFSSVISANELLRVTQQLNAILYKPIELYTGLGIFFLVICLPIFVLAELLKARWSRNLSER